MTLCIGQLQPITVYTAGFWVCVVLVLSAIMFSFHKLLDNVLFDYASCDYYCDFYYHPLILKYFIRLSVLSSSGSARPWMFPPLDVPFEYWTEHVTFGLLSTIIFYRRVPGFATDFPCGVWCRGLITCLLYVGYFYLFIYLFLFIYFF